MMIPLPLAITSVFAVPKSMDKSFEKRPTTLLKNIFCPMLFFWFLF